MKKPQYFIKVVSKVKNKTLQFIKKLNIHINADVTHFMLRRRLKMFPEAPNAL